MKEEQHIRNASVDIMKGIGIIFVILGHCLGFFQGTTETIIDDRVNSIINSFHMPLFFVVGGVLHKHVSLEKFVTKRLHSIIIPYLLYELTNGILTLTIYLFTYLFDFTNENRIIFLQIFKLQGGWFLISYFLTCTSYLMVELLCNKNIQKVGITSFLLSGLSLIVSAVNKNGMTSYILTSFVGMFFYFLGFLLKMYENDFSKKKRFLIGMSALLINFSGNIVFPNDVRMYSNSYGNIIRFLIYAIVGSLGTYFIAKTVEHCKVLETIGKNSLIIMAIQFPIYQAIAYTIDMNEKLYLFKLFPLNLIYIGVTIVTSCSVGIWLGRNFSLFFEKLRLL